MALIHSPLVGPSCWRQVASRLGSGSIEAVAVDYGGVAGPDWYGGAAARAAAAFSSADDVIIVAHSGAGGLVSSLGERLGAHLVGTVLVDAVMPYPGRCWFDTASEVMAALQPIEHELLPEAVRLIARGVVGRDPDNPRRVIIRP